MHIRDLGTKQKILAGVIAPMLFLLVLGSIAIYSINSIVRTNQAVERSQDILIEATALRGIAVDMETSMRGYLLAGKEELLAPYNEGEASAFTRITELQEKVKDNPVQVVRLNEVRRVLEEWQERVTAPMIRLRRAIGDSKTMNDMARLVGEAKGKVFFDDFREQFGSFIRREEGLLANRHIEFETAASLIDRNIQTVLNSSARVNRAHEVLAAADKLLASAVDMETGMRGFLLAGEEDFLVPYDTGKLNFFRTVGVLSQSVAGNFAQVTRLADAEQTIEQWIKDVALPAILMRRDVNRGVKTRQDIELLISKKNSRIFFETFREQMAAFKSYELQRMADRRRNVQEAEGLVSSNLKVMASDEGWLRRTNEVIRRAYGIQSAAIDMQTGMRGYLLSGRETFLQPYNAGQNRFYNAIRDLRDEMRGDPVEANFLSQSEKTIRDWQRNVTDPTIQLRREIGDAKTMDDMAGVVAEYRGKQYFDKFRLLMAAFEAEERGLMALRVAANSKMVRTTYSLVAASVFLALLTGLVVAWLIGSNIAKPIIETTSAIHSFASGDAGVRVPDHGRRDEVGTLGAAFNLMADQLRDKDHLVREEIQVRIQAEKTAHDARYELERQQDELVQLKKMESIGSLTAGIAHNLNNFLHPIGMFSALLKQQFNEGSDEHEMASRILMSSEQARDLIRRLMAYSRMESGTKELLPLAALVEDTLALVKPTLPATVTVKMDLASDVGLVLLNSGEIQTAILNLISNAVDAMQGLPGDVLVKVSRKMAAIGGDDVRLQEVAVIIVTDTGAGMDDETLSMMFDPFYTTKTVGKGTGLGLSTVYGTVSDHGGRVKCKSALGEGTSFEILLPLPAKLSKTQLIA